VLAIVNSALHAVVLNAGSSSVEILVKMEVLGVLAIVNSAFDAWFRMLDPAADALRCGGDME